MKFPTHIILDVSRPTSVNATTNFVWQQFYCNKFVKTNSLFSTQQLSTKLPTDRILVTKTQVVTTSNKNLGYIKNNKTSVDLNVNKYFTPYKSQFSQVELKNCKNLVKIINTNSLLVKNSSKLNFSLLNNSSKNQLFISDLLVKNFKLEKCLYTKFSLRNQQQLSKLDTNLNFKSWVKLLPSTNNINLNDTNPLLDYQTNGVSGVNTISDYKFCFQNFTTTLKIEQPSKRLLNKHVRSKYTQYPNRSRLNALFDINFLVKEMHYSKLKYSKTAERDIVSSGSAALFAGFIGFLISEKFGIELVDSGDFYFIVMYAIFIGFSIKAFVSGLETHVTNWDKYGDKQNYDSKPHKWLSLSVNIFTYFFTILHLVLRLPYNLLHSTYAPLSISVYEIINSVNIQFLTYSVISYVSNLSTFFNNFSKQTSDYYKR